MQPILDFLGAAKQAAAGQDIADILDEEYQRLSPQDAEPLERWQKMKNELLQADPAGIQEMRVYHAAQFASISIPALMRELFRIHAALVIRSDATILSQFGPALRSAEGLIELYLAGAELREPCSDKRN